MVLLLPLPRPTHHRTSFLKICVSRHVQNGSHMEAIGACRWPNHCCCGTIGPCVQLVRSRLRCRCRCRFHPRFDTPASKAHIRQQRAAIWAWFRGLGGNLIKCAPFTTTTTPPMLLADTVMLPQPATSCPLPPSLHTRNGVNLTKVVLPVELCEPRSFLSRLTDSWAYLDLLHAAAEARCVCVCVLKGRRRESGWQWYMYACASWRGDKR